MVLIALVSAKGSPGVTTLALALAGVHRGVPREGYRGVQARAALVADLDPAGGDLALRFPDLGGHALDPDRGLLSLGAAVRRGGMSVHEHLQQQLGGLEVLVGVTAPEQITGLGPVWPAVAVALRELPGYDVFADCGRITPGSATLPVLAEADAVVLVARSTVEQLAHLRERLRWLSEVLRIGGQNARPLGVVLIAPERERTVITDVQRLLDAARLPARVLGLVADDAKGALALAGRARAAVGRTTLVRSVRSLAPVLDQFVAPGAVVETARS